MGRGETSPACSCEVSPRSTPVIFSEERSLQEPFRFMKRPFYLLFFALVCAVGQVGAQTIVWASTDAMTSQLFTSRATTMPAGVSGFKWELGVFLDASTGANWQPTVDNMSEWSAHWIKLGEDTAEEDVPHSFGGLGRVPSAQTNGKQLYIWGYNDKTKFGSSASELVLFTGPANGQGAWVAPVFESLDFPPYCTVDTATSVIYGRLDTNGSAAGGVIEGAGVYGRLMTEGTFEVQSGSWPSTLEITGHPTGQAVKAGQRVTMQVVAEAGSTLSYQWLKEGVEISDGLHFQGARTANLTLWADVPQAGSYTCRVSDGGVPLVSNAAVLSVSPVPFIQVPELPTTSMVSGLWNYTVTANNGVKLWKVTGLPPGVTFNVKTGLLSGSPSKAGSYTLSFSATNAVGASEVTTHRVVVQALTTQLTGAFAGLIERESALTDSLGGSVALSIVPSAGSFTGSLVLGGTRHALSGKIDSTAATGPGAGVTILRPKKASLRVSFQINPQNGKVSGQVTDGVATLTWTAERNPWTITNTAMAFAARYNLSLMPGTQWMGSTSHPQGSGFLSTVISKQGTMTLAGKLADGTAITQSAFVAANGRVPIFANLLTNLASLVGWIEIRATPEPGKIPVVGPLSWMRKAKALAPPRNYGSGFSEMTVLVEGGRYTPTTKGVLALAFPLGPENASMVFAGGGLTEAEVTLLNKVFTLKTVTSASPAQVCVFPKAGSLDNPASLSLTVNGATGAFSAKFTLKDANVAAPSRPITRLVTAEGVLLQDLQQGRGFFLLPQLPNVTTSLLRSGAAFIQAPSTGQ